MAAAESSQVKFSLFQLRKWCASSKMAHNFSEDKRFTTWRKVWLHLPKYMTDPPSHSVIVCKSKFSHVLDFLHIIHQHRTVSDVHNLYINSNSNLQVACK